MQSSENWRETPQGHWLLTFVIVASVHLLLNFVWTYNRLTPVHQDDYLALGGSLQHLGWSITRPVSTNIIHIAGSIGPRFSYLLLNLVVIMVQWLTLMFVERVFRIRSKPFVVIVFSLIVFSHHSAYEHSRVLGTFTNLLSHFFGLLSLHAILGVFRGHRRLILPAMGTIAFSVLAKEDFILPPLLVMAFLLFAPNSSNAKVRGGAAWLIAVSISACVVISVLYGQLLASNPFVAGLFGQAQPVHAVGSYAVASDGTELLASVRKLVVEFAGPISLMYLVVWLFGFVVLPQMRAALLLCMLIVVALLAPYAMLPHNMPSFRVFAWIGWMAAVVILVPAAIVREPRLGKKAALSIFCFVNAMVICVAALNFREREAMVTWYAQQTRLQERYLDSLVAMKSKLDGADLVGVAGVEGLSPWSNTDADFLRNQYGLKNKWVIYVRGSSMFFDLAREDDPSWQSGHRHVSVKHLESICRSNHIPVVVFNSNGDYMLSDSKAMCNPPK